MTAAKITSFYKNIILVCKHNACYTNSTSNLKSNNLISFFTAISAKDFQFDENEIRNRQSKNRRVNSV